MDYQYLYLVKQGRITKIGITDNVQDRFSAIRYDTGAGIKVLFLRRLFYAKNKEKALHKRYKTQKKVHKGRGKEEWFKLNFLQRIFLVLELNFIWLLTWICLLALFSVSLFGLFSLFRLLS